MSKKKLLVLLFGLVLLTLAGCAMFYPKRAEVFLWVYVEPESAYTRENPSYRAFARLDDRGEKEPKLDFHDAIVKVNNVKMSPDAQGTFSTGVQANLRLKPGAKVKVYIKHPKLGTFRKTLRIPPVVAKLSSSDNLEGYIKGTPGSFNLSWDEVKCGEYIAKAYFYPTPTMSWTDVYSTQIKENKAVFTGDYLNTLKAQKPYVKFEVNAVNAYLPKQFYEGSVIQVVGPAGGNISNLPRN